MTRPPGPGPARHRAAATRSALRFATLTLVGLPTASGRLSAQEAAPSYEVDAATSAITVDGVLDEPAWGVATPIPLRWQYAPSRNAEPPVETTCYVTYDVLSLYLACRAADPEPSRIQAHLAERDDRARIHQDDHFAFLIDAFNDERRGFQFRLNAAGVQWDAIHVKSEGFEDFSWDALWYSAVRTHERGYDVEVEIPFSSLRFPASAGPQTWGFILERSYPRAGVRYRMRSVPTYGGCMLCGANKLTGFRDIEPGGSIELVPVVTARREDARVPFPDGELLPTEETDFADVEPDIGFDARWGVTPSTSLNAMVNPDFSNVEADDAQLAVNRRFALRFPEKRAFFLEGVDFFQTHMPAVFTRQFVQPDGGVKVTGQEGSHTFGVFAVRDATTEVLIPSNQRSRELVLDQTSTGGVARYRYDLTPTSYVGALFTGRAGDDYHNVVGGVDALFQLGARSRLRVQYIRSGTDYPDSLAASVAEDTGSFGGGALDAELSTGRGRWGATLSYRDMAPGFRADLGFIPRVDLRSGSAVVRRFLGSAAGGVVSLVGRYSRTQDYDGDLTDQTLGATLSYAGPRQSTARLSGSRVDQLHDGVLYDLDVADLAFDVRPSPWFTLNATLRVGDFVDFTNDRESFGVAFRPGALIDFGQRLSLYLGQEFQRLSYDGDRVFTANLVQGRIIYHFNLRTFVRGVVQYRRVTRDPALYVMPVDDRTERLFTQLVFSYRLSPRTSLYMGYRDQQDGADAYDLLTRNRQFFVKFGYAVFR